MKDDLHRELWTSFASLLSSYGAAHGMNGPHQAIVEIGNDLILVRAGSRWIRFTRAEILKDDGSGDSFRMNEDGTATIGGRTEEMDFAAERLMRELMG
ncbi:MAG: transcriptional regulator [Acidobacteriaceae bacterium]